MKVPIKSLNPLELVSFCDLNEWRNGSDHRRERSERVSLKEWWYKKYKKNQKIDYKNFDWLADFLQIAVQISECLQQLHDRKIIYRQLNPFNILVCPISTKVYFSDFNYNFALTPSTQYLKSSNCLERTLAYLSPEQTGRMNRGIDYRTDFYSLGIVFYELLTMQLPFSAEDPMEWIYCHLAKNPPTVHEQNPKIPQVLSNLVKKLIAKNAEDRYQSALGLKQDLEQCRSEWVTTGQVKDFELGQNDICDYFIIPDKLYGRNLEVQTLLNTFERVSQGNQEILFILGESGVGKTAVIQEIHQPIIHKKGYFIQGKFDQFQRNIPYSAILQAFQGLMKQLLTENSTRLEQWKAKILQALGENSQVIIDVIPELEQIIGCQPAVPELIGTANQNRFHLLFQRFTQIFASVDSPLVIFLDDLQWIDSASLQLIQILMSQTEIHYLLLIGAYRDNEVNSIHPLNLALKEIQNSAIPINQIQLKCLQVSDLNHCIQETLRCSPEVAEPITQLIYQKTQGNPFFSHQFLHSLHEDELIQFNVNSGYWEYDLNQIQTLSLTEDVVEFMLLQLKKLPPETQNVLKLAACIGNEFNWFDLAIVSEQSPLQTYNALQVALKQGLILSKYQDYQFDHTVNSKYTEQSQENPQLELTCCSYKFLHDRVQQAAYSLISPAQKYILHHRIGQLFLSQLSEVEQDSKIFDIVNHLNISISTIKVQSESEQLIQLNLKAARKAQATTAYDIALEYATTAIQLLPAQAWQEQYSLSLELCEIAMEVASILGEFEQMQAWIDIILQQAKIPLDQVKAYEVKIQTCASQNKMLEAIVTARQALKLFNVEFPKNIKPTDINQAMATTAAKLSDHTLEEIVNLPTMTDANQLAIGRIILSMIPATFIAEPALFPVIVSSQVKASLDFGNSPASSFFYANYSLILAGNVQDFETANWLGRLCLDLINRLEDKDIKSRTYFVLGTFIFHTQSPLKETVPLLQKAYQMALEVGNLEFVGYASKDITRNLFYLGHNLTDLEQEINTYHQLLSGYNKVTASRYCQILGKTVSKLLNPSEIPNFNQNSEQGFDSQTEIIYQQLVDAQDIMGLFEFYLDKLILCYLFGDIDQAQKYAIQARKYLAGGTGLVSLPVFYFYDSLIAIEFCTQNPSQWEQDHQQIQQNQEKLQKWAESAPMNHQHKFALVKAEYSRILGDKIQASEMYDQAINLAQQNQFVNEFALANERAAQFYLSWKRERIAKEYLTNAYLGYTSWGAIAKVQALQKKHPFLKTISSSFTDYYPVNQQVFPLFVNSANSSITETIDLTTVLKASQALAGEIHLEKLLEKLIHIITENAGAEKCVLTFYRDNNWIVEAVQNSQNSATILKPCLLKDSPDLAQSIVNYVARTEETWMIEDASQETTLATDTYVVEQQPKSILCMPIHHRSKLIGIIYLENNLMRGAFTNNHLTVLNLLTTQIAISLENALLYADLAEANHTLEDKVEQRTQQLNQKNEEISQQNVMLQETLVQLKKTQAQLVQVEKMSSLGQMVAGIAHEINNPVSFIHGNVTHVQEYFQDLLNLIDTVQQSCPVLPEEVQTITEEIDLEFIKEDLPQLFQSMKFGTKRIRDIVKSLRNFSRLDESDLKKVDIHQGIDSTLLVLNNRLKFNKNYPEIRIIQDYGNLPLVSCYAGQLNQVFMNILNNAIDALLPTQENGKSTTYPEIRIHTTTLEDNFISIQISDNGSGITEELCSKIFDPFFTTKPVGQGTGLGLSVCYQIVVERHGGRLTCESSPGEGTKFMIDIPIK